MTKKIVLITTASIVCIVAASLFFLPKHKDVVSYSDAQLLRNQVTEWKRRINDVGPQQAYADFLTEAPNKEMSTHDQAHAFGEALYAQEGLSGLSYCDSSFEFGCYHSFFGVAVHEEGIDVLSQFSDACKARFGAFNLPCEHGIGHGVLVYTDYDNLEQALELCETISDMPTGGCSSGVFMENNFHTMDETVGDAYVRPLSVVNPYEPCDSLPLRFQASCYIEQVQFWQQHYRNDFSKIGALCTDLAESSQTNFEACFHGVGNYLAAAVDLDVEASIEGCLSYENVDEQRLCAEGAAWLIRGDGSRTDDAQKVCSALTTTQGRGLCSSTL